MPPLERVLSIFTLKTWFLLGLFLLALQPLALCAQPTNPGSQSFSFEKGMASPGGQKIASLIVNEKNKEEPLLLHIEDIRTKKASEFPLLDQDGNACSSVLNMTWLSEDTLGVECHINPSLNNYLLVDTVSGKCRKNFYGYNFSWSPDGKVLAHVGAIVHFAPAENKSEYLQFNDKTVYPQPLKVDSVGKSVHSFSAPFSWSADSKRVAFFDTVSQGSKDASASFLVVVDRDGRVSRKSLSFKSGSPAQINWAEDSRSLCVSDGNLKKQLKVKLPF